MLSQKGTAVKQPAKELTKNQESSWTQLRMPLASQVRGDLLSLVHELGMQAVAAMLEAERTKLCGERYKHDPERQATRGGSARGELALGGRRVVLRRPRVVDKDGHEIPLETWTELGANDPLEERAVEQMAIGVATRKYARSLDALPDSIETRGTSKSAVSRRFVAATQQKLSDWLDRPLDRLDIVTVFIDGIHFGEYVVLVALGLDAKGDKHVLSMREGATENEVACKEMLADIVARGLKADRTRLFVIDGSKGLRAAVRSVFGRRALVQRCQIHKMENVVGHLPGVREASTRSAMREAYRCPNVPSAKRLLNNLARSLEKKYPSAAASLREGLDETLTVIGLGLPRSLSRSLSTTNPIESLNDRLRTTARRVKHWGDGSMVLRWVLVGTLEAEQGFRRLKGYKDIPTFVAALQKARERNDKPAVDAQRSAA